MRTILLLRSGLLALMLGALLSCGGGGGGGGGTAAMGPAVMGSGGEPGVFSPAGGDSGGNGIGGIAADDGSGTTASAGGDDGGVGSGGTGVSTADATGVGAVDGAGSIIVNGLRYDTSMAAGNVQDAPNGLQLGMSVKVTGPVNADFTRGVARTVESAADIRGSVASVNLAAGSFAILGTTVSTDEATVWADLPGLGGIAVGQTLQVWGLPGAPGVLRATRIEQRPASPPILTGTVQNLNTANASFSLGGVAVDYGGATLATSLYGQPLSNGALVRVRGDLAPNGRLIATQVQWWYPLPMTEGSTAQFAGIVTDFAGLGSLRVLGFPVDASGAPISGGLAGSVGNGVKVEVGGVVSGGVLRATKLKIRHVPGTGGPASFDLFGNVGSFNSPSDFRVKGQPVDAGGPGVMFTNGQPSNLGNGVRVRIHGSRVLNGVLIAETVSFE